MTVTAKLLQHPRTEGKYYSQQVTFLPGQLMKGAEKLGGLLNIIYFLNREESFKTSFLKKRRLKKKTNMVRKIKHNRV